MVPHCVTLNCTKSSWDYRRCGESRQWRYKKPQAIRRLSEIPVRVGWPPDVLLHCPECEAVAPGYDTRPRRWRHLNTMQGKTFIEADVPRVNCLKCGVKQIPVVWAEDGSRLPELFEAYAIQVLQAVRSKVQAQWLTALSWDLSRPGHGPCGPQAHNVERAVTRGVARRSWEGLRYAGLDGKSFGKGHDYVSVLHDLEGRRVLEVVPERTREAANTLWTAILKPQRLGLAAVALDMWVPYLEATRVAAPQALIVHDKFPCAKEYNKAVDRVRRREHRELQAQGIGMLTKTRYLWLKNPLNGTDRQRERFQTLKVDALKVGRAWAIKEAFANFWDYRYTGSAHKFFDRGFLGDPLTTPAHHCRREDS